ncbi:hypothetical protein L7F22_037347 [Adiantum nelumboides]|nr:hypothetical protein [Adiantum nelumboides]
MKSSSRTLDELRFLLKERSEIELEYSKKLSKLSKISLGKEEIGALKNALDTIRNELEISAKSHAELAGVMKGGLENSVTEFQNRVNSARKQDFEEERLDFIKTKSWDYANAVSAVCVADDEIRQSTSITPKVNHLQLVLRSRRPTSSATQQTTSTSSFFWSSSDQGGGQNGSQVAPAPQQQQQSERARQNSSGGSQSGSQALVQDLLQMNRNLLQETSNPSRCRWITWNDWFSSQHES